MQVRVLFFGRLKDIVGKSEESAELSDGARVVDLFARYGRSFPELAQFRSSVVASVNQEIGEQMREKFSIRRFAMVHRLGRLEIGETSVLVVVCSAHRAAAFDACRFGIDTLKSTVPIWKKEFFRDGAAWAEGEIPSV